MQITSPQHRFQSWLLAYCWKYWYGWRLKIPPHGLLFHGETPVDVVPLVRTFHHPLLDGFQFCMFPILNYASVSMVHWLNRQYHCYGLYLSILFIILSYSYNIAWRTCAHTPAPTGYTTIASPHQSPGMVLMSTTQRPTMPTASPNLVTSCHLLWVCPQLLQNYICEGKIEISPQSSWKIQ